MIMKSTCLIPQEKENDVPNDIISRLQKFICITNDKVTEERNKVLRDAIEAIKDRDVLISELDRNEWKKYD